MADWMPQPDLYDEPARVWSAPRFLPTYDLINETPARHWSATAHVPDSHFVEEEPFHPTGLTYAHRVDHGTPDWTGEGHLLLHFARWVEKHPREVAAMRSRVGYVADQRRAEQARLEAWRAELAERDKLWGWTLR